MNKIYEAFLNSCDRKWTGVKSKIKTENKNVVTCFTKCKKLYFDDISHIQHCMRMTLNEIEHRNQIDGRFKIYKNAERYAIIKFILIGD